MPQTDTTPTWTTDTGSLTDVPLGATIWDSAARAATVVSGASGYVRAYTAAGATTWTDSTISTTYPIVNVGRTVGARDDDVLCALYVTDEGSGVQSLHLRKYTSASSTADWSHTIGSLSNVSSLRTNLGCNADGSLIVTAESRSAASVTTVRGYSTSGTPDWTIQHPSVVMRGLSVAADADRVLIGTDTTARVYDMATGALVFSMPATGGTSRVACAISPDGNYAMQIQQTAGFWVARAYDCTSGSPVLLRAYQYTTLDLGHQQADACAISDGGLYMAQASAARSASFPIEGVWLLAKHWDLVADSLETEVALRAPFITGGGISPRPDAYQCVLSSNGKRMLIGNYGDGAGRIPEVLAFSLGYMDPDLTYRARHSTYGAAMAPSGNDVFVAQRGDHHAAGGGAPSTSTAGCAWFDKTWAARR